MPNRHGSKILNNREQRECSSASSQGALRAHPAVPGRIPLREEAELLQGVTRAPAEPEAGAILFGHNWPSTVGFSLYTRIGIETCRLGHESIGSTIIPLRNINISESNDSAITVLIRGQPEKYNDVLEFNGSTEAVLIRGQSVGPPNALGIDSASAICGLSKMEVGERHEGAKELSTSDTTNTDLLNDFVLIDDNIVSHSLLDNHKIIGSTGSTLEMGAMDESIPEEPLLSESNKMDENSMGLRTSKWWKESGNGI